MPIWKDTNERFLLLLTILVFSFLCAIEAKFPIFSFVNCAFLETFLLANATKTIASTLLSGFISAYIFYIFIDYYPRHRRERKAIEVLNLLIASVLDAYKRSRLFGHETAITFVDKSSLNKEWLDNEINILRGNQSKFLPLKFAMQTAHTRIEDFRHSLPLAVSLSPEYAMRWLVIIDKIRLLAEEYNKQPIVPKEKIGLIDTESSENPIKDYKSTLNLRFLEILEESRLWLYPESQHNV